MLASYSLGQPPHTRPSLTGFSPSLPQNSSWALAGSPQDPTGNSHPSFSQSEPSKSLTPIRWPCSEARIGPHLSGRLFPSAYCSSSCPHKGKPTTCSASPLPQAARRSILQAPALLYLGAGGCSSREGFKCNFPGPPFMLRSHC